MPATPLIKGHAYRHYRTGTVVRVTGWSILKTASGFKTPIVTFVEEGAIDETSRPRDFFVDSVQWGGRTVPRFEHLGEMRADSTP